MFEGLIASYKNLLKSVEWILSLYDWMAKWEGWEVSFGMGGKLSKKDGRLN
jgi:hypothetical protein